jgi:hypothetical protein
MYGRAHGNRVSGGAGPSHSSASDIVNRTAAGTGKPASTNLLGATAAEIEAQQKKK